MDKTSGHVAHLHTYTYSFYFTIAYIKPKTSTYSWFHIKRFLECTMETIYLSIMHTGSRGNLFLEIPGIWIKTAMKIGNAFPSTFEVKYKINEGSFQTFLTLVIHQCLTPEWYLVLARVGMVGIYIYIYFLQASIWANIWVIFFF